MRRFAALLLALVVAQPAAAQQPKASRTLAEELEGEARASFEQGRALFEHGDFLTAHAKFRMALESSGNARLLWNLAACSSKLKRYGRALREAQRYLEAGEALTPEQREKANAFVRELRGLVSEATFVVSPAGARLSIDGEDRGVVEETSTHALELGPHDVNLAREGFLPLQRQVDVRDTAATMFSFRLEEQRALGRLVVETDADARVDVDGARAGHGLVEVRLLAGVHRVAVTRDGYEPFEADVVIARDTTRQLQATLRPRDAWYQGWIPITVGSVVLAAGLGVGGYYLFKPEPIQAPFVRGSTGFDFVLR